MAYTKTVWADRQVQYPMRFQQAVTGTQVTLTPDEGTIIASGTPLTAANLNNIENTVSSLDTDNTANKTNITALQNKWSSGSGTPTTVPSAVGLIYIDTTNKGAYISTGTSATTDWEQLDQVTWANVLSKPTTISGYGITDHSWTNLLSKPTTISGYGITDNNWANLLSKPTTISGYGITDAQPKYTTGTAAPSTAPSSVGLIYVDTTNKKVYISTGASAVGDWEQVDQVDWSNVLSKPTTISGYGITDHSWTNLLSKPTTLSGFGITDAYTKTESDTNYTTQSWVKGFGLGGVSAGSVDWNTLVNGGLYTGIANAPNSGALNVSGVHVQNGATYSAQFVARSDSMWFRTQENGVWGSWFPIANMLNGGTKIASGSQVGGAAGVTTVTFPTAFSTGTPVVLVTPRSLAGIHTSFYTINVTTTGFQIYHNTQDWSARSFHWAAIGS